MKKITFLYISIFFLAGCQTIPPGRIQAGQTASTQAANFQFKNQVWDYSGSGCNSEIGIRSWVDDGSGSLFLYEITEQGLAKNKVLDFKKDFFSSVVTFVYQNPSGYEIFNFSGNTAYLKDKVVNGAVIVKNEIHLQRNQYIELTICGSQTNASKLFIQHIQGKVPKPTRWNFPNTSGDRLSYCAGVFNYASKSSDNPTGKRMTYDLYLKATAMAKQAKVNIDRFSDLAQKGSENASAIYKEAFEKDMRNGKIDPTMTARSEIRYAVQECQNSLR